MKVSSSKFTFTIIAFAALLVSGSGIMAQDAFAAIDAPEFTCNHINTTATHCTFDQSVNGTLAILDWTLKTSSTQVAGSSTTDITITNVANATSTGIGQTAPSSGDIAATTVADKIAGLGYINGTDIVISIREGLDFKISAETIDGGIQSLAVALDPIFKYLVPADSAIVPPE